MNEQEIESRLELLAVGELEHEERVRVLNAMADNPQLWKRCALLLLEERELRSGIQVLCREPSAADFNAEKQQLPESNESLASIPTRSQRFWLSIAASLFLGLVGGFASRNGFSPTSSALENRKEVEAAGNELGVSIARDNGSDVKASESGGRFARIQTPSGEHVSLVGFVKITDLDRPESSFFSPIVRDNENHTGLLQAPAMEMPSRVVRQINRSGWQVHNDRKVVSVHFSGGDRVEIPMNQVRYQYVGRPVL